MGDQRYFVVSCSDSSSQAQEGCGNLQIIERAT